MTIGLPSGLIRLLERLRASDEAPWSGPRDRVEAALRFAKALTEHSGDAGQMKLANALADAYRQLDETDARAFFARLVSDFAPDPVSLSAAVNAYLEVPGADRGTALHKAAEPPRQELIRRLNTARGGTELIVGMRERALQLQARAPEIAPLAVDLHHLLASWFNRGFLQLRQITWHTPAAILEKLIRYEAVHAIQDWSDLKNRVEGARRCFGFFHPSMPDEPLIFIEVALTNEMADDIAPLLARADDGEEGPAAPRAAIFYSISNCQPGLRNIQFGDFLIKQVVAELRAELPSLRMFATLSPIPGFRSWLDHAARAGVLISPALASALAEEGWSDDRGRTEMLRGPLTALCARYLTGLGPDGRQGVVTDPVARFHLSNGARLERINWRADLSAKGIKQSWGMMVNYRYHPTLIDSYQEAFAFDGHVQRSGGVAVLLNAPVRLSKAVGAKARVTSDR